MSTKTSLGYVSSRLQDKRTLNDPGGNSYATNSVINNRVSYTRTRTGVSNPKWRSIIKSGGDATTPFTGSDVKVLEETPFFHTCGFKPVPGDKSDYVETISGFSSVYTDIPGHIGGTSLQEADNQALKRAYSRLQNYQGSFQGIVALGELRETIHLLRNPLLGVQKIYKTFLEDLSKSKSLKALKDRRTAKNRKSFLEEAADKHLAVAFGVKPLLSDAEELVGAILKQTYGTHRTVLVGTGKDVKAADSAVYEFFGNYTSVVTNRVDVTTRSVKYKMFIDLAKTADFGSISGVQKALGFDPSQFVPGIYNLIPWSFLVDYVSNLGDVIEAGCTSQENVRFVVRTDRLETVRVQTIAPHLATAVASSSRFWSDGGQPGSSVIARRTVSRSSSSALGMPTLTTNLPTRMQGLNILALLKANEKTIQRHVVPF